MRSASSEYKYKSATGEAQFVPIGIQNVHQAYLICLIIPSTRYLYLRWQFLFMKQSWTNLELRVSNSCVDGREVNCFDY